MLTLTCPFDRYQLPEDAAAVHATILAAINGATTSLHLFMYGYDSRPFADALLAAQKRNVDCQLVLDHTQSAGPGEHALLLYMVANGFPADHIVITTSPSHRQIMHEKCLIVDRSTVFEGSLNWSARGEQQVNSVVVFHSPELAAAFAADFERLRAWAIATEPQYQHLLSP